METYTTRVSRHFNAPRHDVYRALIDVDAIRTWKVPDAMTIEVHEHDGREGGRFRISLTYDEPRGVGKTSARTDTYHGRYVTLIPDEKVVEIDEFESSDPTMSTPMTISFTLTDEDRGTNLLAVHEGVPESVPAADNELGWRLSLLKLAELVELR